jgi:hypothetical protein
MNVADQDERHVVRGIIDLDFIAVLKFGDHIAVVNVQVQGAVSFGIKGDRTDEVSVDEHIKCIGPRHQSHGDAKRGAVRTFSKLASPEAFGSRCRWG